ncbi:hypothetical protein QAD02_023692 [Eretmocerus hayati]|uniref:Uncharacterized protein n=1 Tax=Eretmocerus hayati TaxID=131215 RepID=A0ACC2PZY4_9HYME|nr:hypothetical protein QAD02_023692 [Eretmocerus hayati]
MSTAQLMNRLRELGWYLTDQGFESVSDYGNLTDIQKIIKRATESDLKEIGSGEGDVNQSNVVVQIQKVRNISAPKHNEESRGAPRMLKLSLTDGKNSYQAVELETISSISLNTPPGTKLLLNGGTILVSHGIILLRPLNIIQVLGGKVISLVEKWELNKKLASHSRVRPVEEGGPPPWIPFGKKIIKVAEAGKNFKALAEKEKLVDENAEFETQRKNAIAEAARQGSKKVFGGGNKQLLDHSVQKIVDQGFTIEQAEHALKVCRNNVDRALKSLQRNDGKSNGNAREPRELKGKRGEKKSDDASNKPSSGKISLFDFLEDKLPAQIETAGSNNTQNDSHGKERQESYSDRYHPKGNDRNDHPQRGKSGRNSRGSRGYQVPPRHQEENRPAKFSSNAVVHQPPVQFGGGMISQKTRPPRFQRNQNQNQEQDVTNYNQEMTNRRVEPIGRQNAFPQISVFRNALPNIAPFPQPRQDATTPRDYQASNFRQNQQDFQLQNQDYQTKIFNNTRNQNYVTNHPPQNQLEEIDPHHYQSSMMGQNHRRHQSNTFYNANSDFHGAFDMKAQKNDTCSAHFNSHSRNEEHPGGNWVWRVGDRCMAKYWEDNTYYNAEVTAVSTRTCVVLFKDFHNYEEVLQVDCIPITDSDIYVKHFEQDTRKPDYRTSGRPPRFEQNQGIPNTTEYRRGGNSNAANKNYKKRTQQRGPQAIYQPPAQRGAPIQPAFMPQNL